MAEEDSKAWRDKYLDLQESSEARQALLRRGLVCVSLAVDNIDAHLESQLKELRQLLRGDWQSEELAAMVDVMESTVRRLDEHRQQERGSRSDLLGKLIEQFNDLGPDRVQRRQLEAIQARARAGTGEFQELLAEFMAIFSQRVRQLRAEADGESGGFFQRWFRRAGKARAEDTVAAEATTPEGGEDAQEQWQEARQRIAVVLLGMLEQVHDQHAEEVTALQRRWQTAQDPNIVAELIDQSLALHQGLVLARTRETEEFLLNLQRRLLEVHKFLSSQNSQQTQERQAQEEFGRSVEEEISALREHAAAASSLEQLQTRIKERLDGIVGLVDGYREQSGGRARSLHTEVQELEEKLRRLEGESRHLREVVRQEHHRATHDALTGLPNRQAYEERALLEFGRWRRYGHPFSVLIVDVDRFKAVNDQYGHLAGDKVLRLVAQSLQKAVRETDFMARYGGEEFVVLLPQTALDAALVVAEKLRAEVAASPFHFAGSPVPITCSVGVSELRPQDDWEALIERADQALLRAKREGRNRVLAG